MSESKEYMEALNCSVFIETKTTKKNLAVKKITKWK